MLHLGKIIQERIAELNIATSAVAAGIHVNRNNVYQMYARTHFDSDQLIDLSLVIEMNLAIPLAREINDRLLAKRKLRPDYDEVNEPLPEYGYTRDAEKEKLKAERDRAILERDALQTSNNDLRDVIALLKEKLRKNEV